MKPHYLGFWLVTWLLVYIIILEYGDYLGDWLLVYSNIVYSNILESCFYVLLREVPLLQSVHFFFKVDFPASPARESTGR